MNYKIMSLIDNLLCLYEFLVYTFIRPWHMYVVASHMLFKK